MWTVILAYVLNDISNTWFPISITLKKYYVYMYKYTTTTT